MIHRKYTAFQLKDSKITHADVFTEINPRVYVNVSRVNREDKSDGYSVIGENVSQTPAPPLHTQSTRHRPPAPLPSTKQRPYSNSFPAGPVSGSNHSRNTMPLPPRPQPSGSADSLKSKPRPPCNPKPRPSTMGTFPRSRSESSSLGTPAQGFNDVLNQLGAVKLHSPGKKSSTFRDQCSSSEE